MELIGIRKYINSRFHDTSNDNGDDYKSYTNSGFIKFITYLHFNPTASGAIGQAKNDERTFTNFTQVLCDTTTYYITISNNNFNGINKDNNDTGNDYESFQC